MTELLKIFGVFLVSVAVLITVAFTLSGCSTTQALYHACRDGLCR